MSVAFLFLLIDEFASKFGFSIIKIIVKKMLCYWTGHCKQIKKHYPSPFMRWDVG
jgi:hypothetical protein